jgi:hypothetical protein
MKSTSRLFLSSTLLLALGGCATTSTQPAVTPQSEAGETGDTNAASPLPVCKGIADTGNKVSPPEIYDDMRQCALAGNFDKGVALFSLAGAYTFYDALRVEDASTFSVRTDLLRDSLDSLDPPRKAAFKEAIKGALGNDEKRASICKDVMRAGPPDYYPTYMILQGKDGAAVVKSKGGLIAPFDAKTAWSEALNRFLHCSQS